MATMCIRSTDCLAGRHASFRAHHAAPALAPRLPMQKQRHHESQTVPTASPPDVAMNPRSARGWADGQQRRRRRSPPAAGTGAGSPPHKRVMENVVILRRGQVLTDMATAPLMATASAPGPSVAQAVPEKAEIALAGKDAGVAAAEEKMEESVAAAKQSSEAAEKCEAAAAVDQRGALEEAAAETPVAADNVGTETKEEEAMVTTNQSVAETTEENEPEATAGQSGAQEEVAADNIGTETKEEEPVVTTNQSSAERTEEDEPEAAAGQSGAEAETAEPAAAVDQRGPNTPAKEAEAAEHRGVDAVKAEPAPAAHQTLPLAKEVEAEQAYSGASFAAVAPDPRALPIPELLLKPRGRIVVGLLGSVSLRLTATTAPQRPRLRRHEVVECWKWKPSR